MNSTPQTIDQLLSRAEELAGLSLQQVSQKGIIKNLLHNKGWIGQLVESLLGAQAGSSAGPDFPSLGIELKTIPISLAGKPLESTYVSIVPINNLTNLAWEESVVWQKLKRVLWIPIIGDRVTSISDRIIGSPLLWEPSLEQSRILKNDWEEHMEKITLGFLDQLKSSDGVYLQVRPKAADSHVLCSTFDSEGYGAQTLPRGFYLRTRFTGGIIRGAYL